MQPKLAEAAGLGLLKTVEKPRRDVLSRPAVRSIKAALKKAGVRFIGTDGGGTGVRLLGPGKSEFPCRSVAETPIGPSNRQDCIRVRGRRGGFRTNPQRAYSILNKIVPDECG
jgi:hypothetical protein